jgi:hypothetical protein
MIDTAHFLNCIRLHDVVIILSTPILIQLSFDGHTHTHTQADLIIPFIRYGIPAVLLFFFVFVFLALKPFWLYFPQPGSGALAYLSSRFLDHTQQRATVGTAPLDE